MREIDYASVAMALSAPFNLPGSQAKVCLYDFLGELIINNEETLIGLDSSPVRFRAPQADDGKSLPMPSGLIFLGPTYSSSPDTVEDRRFAIEWRTGELKIEDEVDTVHLSQVIETGAEVRDRSHLTKETLFSLGSDSGLGGKALAVASFIGNEAASFLDNYSGWTKDGDIWVPPTLGPAEPTSGSVG